jgi:hypothetical protein
LKIGFLGLIHDMGTKLHLYPWAAIKKVLDLALFLILPM